MPDTLKLFMRRMSTVFNIWPDYDNVVLDRKGFARDSKALEGDFAAVCNDFREAVERAEKKEGLEPLRSKMSKATLSHSEDEIEAGQHEADSFILPVGQIERLQQVNPKVVDFIIEETRRKADLRREQTDKTNSRSHETIKLGQVFAFITMLVGIGTAGYVAVAPQASIAHISIIIAITITVFAVAFVYGRR